MSGTILTASAAGDYTTTGPAGLSNMLTQSGATPVDVSYFSLDLSTLTAAQVAGIEAGTETVTLSFGEVGDGSGQENVLVTGTGLTATDNNTLTSGNDGTSGYALITNAANKVAQIIIGPGTGTTYAVDVTAQVAQALVNGDTYFVIGASETSGTTSDITGVTLDVTCYGAGTMLRTPQGDRPVQELRAGDLVLTGTDGAVQPIRWIGERTIDLRAHPQPALAAPIRIAADAFADGVPARDLLMSPDHGVYVDGRLIPARRLLNGTTVIQLLDLAEIHYVHVELERHALLCAEGLLAESYLDTGNRAIFSNAGAAVILHPDLSGGSTRSWHTDACAPFATSEEARAVWQHLVDRAVARGWDVPALSQTAQNSAPGLRLAGRIVPPAIEGSRLIFALPRGTTGLVRLTSRAAAPAALRPWEDDRRALGLCVHALILHGANGARRIALDDPALGAGWWGLEAGPHGPQRWTAGNAAITLPPGEQAEALEVVLLSEVAQRTAPTRHAA